MSPGTVSSVLMPTIALLRSTYMAEPHPAQYNINIGLIPGQLIPPVPHIHPIKSKQTRQTCQTTTELSIVGKDVEFNNVVHTIRPSVILVMESWLTPTQKDSPRDSTSQGVGGVFIAISEDLNPLAVSELCEILWLNVKLQGHHRLLVHPHRACKQYEGLC